MRSKKRRLLELAGVIHRSDLLLEEEEEGGLFDDPTGDEEEGDDEGEADEKEEKPEEGTDDEKEEKEEEEETPDPVEKLSPSDIAKYGEGEVDDELNSVLEKIYLGAIERAKVRSVTSLGYPGHVKKLAPAAVKEETRKYSLLNILLEEREDPPAEEFDLNFYAKEIARYIKNYDTLLDLEGMIYNKARQMLLNQFGKETEDEFVELLERVHDLNFGEVDNSNPEHTAAHTPVATGASGGE